MDFDAPPRDPIEPLRAWMRDAEQVGLPNPNAMVLGTVDPDGRPSARVVLLKELDATGATFFTNYASRKGRALAAHPDVSLVMHWDPLHRQVVMEGVAARVSDATSDAYFASRPRGSQLGAWASRQSEPVASRAALDEAYAEVERRFAGGAVPRPPFWGGFRVQLRTIMFWQARVFRLHDRIRYTVDGAGGWNMEWLYP